MAWEWVDEDKPEAKPKDESPRQAKPPEESPEVKAGFEWVDDAEAKQTSYEQGKAEGNPIIRGLMNVAQGPTFGFGDEIYGGVRALFDDAPLREGYAKHRDYARGVQDKYREDFPVGSVLTQIAAGAPLAAAKPFGFLGQGAKAVAPGLAAKYQNMVAPAQGVAGMIPRALDAARVGLGYGALAGAGTSKEDELAGVTKDALKSGAMGAASGAGLSFLGSAIGAGASNIGQRFSDKAAGSHAKLKVAEAINRDAVGSEFENGALDQIRRVAHKMESMGGDARLADASGRSTQKLLDMQATLPGKTANKLEQLIHNRQASRANRLYGMADDALGTGKADYAGTLKALDFQRKAAAKPLYEQVQNLSVQIDDDLANLLQRTDIAHRDAQKLYKLKEGVPLDLSKLKVGERVPFGALDRIKRAMFDLESEAKRAGRSDFAREVGDARTALIDKLDDVSPKVGGESIYKLARDTYAGPSQLMAAQESGREIFKHKLPELQEMLGKMGDSERAAMRIGALQAIKEKTGTESGQTALLKMWKETTTSDRLKAVFGNDYRKFAAAVAKEARLKPMERLGRGSESASRLFGAGDLDVSAVDDVANAARSAATGSPTGLIQAALGGLKRVQTPESVRDEIGSLLMTKDPTEVLALSPLLQQVNAARLNRARTAGGFTGLLGGLL